MGIHLRSDCWCSFRESSLRVSLRFGCFEDNEGVGVAPNFFFARISRLETTMRSVCIKKSESYIVQIILRQLPERYDIAKIMTLADPQLTRSRLESTIRSAYSQRKAHEIAKQWPAVGAPAEPSSPALVVGCGFRDRGAVGGGAIEGTTV